MAEEIPMFTKMLRRGLPVVLTIGAVVGCSSDAPTYLAPAKPGTFKQKLIR